MKPILNMKTYSVVRTTAPDAINGRKVTGTESTITMRANLQPIGRKLNSMPEARRADDLRRFFTTADLYVAGRVVGGVTYDSDQVLVNSERFEVFQVDEWPGHFECFASRIETP